MLDPPEQDRILELAVEHHLSSRDIRKMCKGELYVDDNGNVIESADRIEQEQPTDKAAPNAEAAIAEARQQLNPTLNKLEGYLLMLGYQGEHDAALAKLRQYGEMLND